MTPSFSMQETYDKSALPFSREEGHSVHTDLPMIDCPQGTVPIPRTTKDDLIRERSLFKNFPCSFQSIKKGGDYYAAGIQSKVKGSQTYLKVKSDLSINAPYIYSNSQWSGGVVSVEGRDDTIKVGWMVNPGLYGDKKTRMFTLWAANNNQTGCFNLRCRGFVRNVAENYETASEGEDDGEDADEKQDVLSKDGCIEDAVDDELVKQRALSEENDAKDEGNKLFGSGQYEDALSKYEHALSLVSEMQSFEEIRSVCHSNRAICYMKLEKYEDTIKECTKALELNPKYMKALVRRGEAHEKLEHYEEAISDMKKIIELDPPNKQANKTILRLEPLAAEKREKMKEEMIGKLKEMGNSILGRFGMSVDNFKAVKDPNTGSYSLSFQR